MGVTFKHSSASHTCAGFTYIGLLILIAIMGVTLAGIGTVWHTKQQRFKEQQLLFIGNQFSRAISAYYQYQVTPDGMHQFPKKLEDLLQDSRQPNTVRYLRKIFSDPFTGSTQWGLIKGADGGILGVHSLSDMQPIKTDNFGRGNEGLTGKKHYSEWQFSYRPDLITQLAAIAVPTAPVIPPEYSVPPPQPLPPNPSVDQSRQRLCQIMRRGDANTCALQATKFGETAGANCMASANQRYAICIAGDNAMLPPLIVQYK